eukprot:60308-Amphidinium_carterae.1
MRLLLTIAIIKQFTVQDNRVVGQWHNQSLLFSAQYFNKILKAYNLEKCKPSTMLGNKTPLVVAESLDKEQHSMYRTARGQLLWVSQLRADIAFTVKELSRSLQQPGNEDLKNLKQLLRYIKGTMHYKLTLASKATYNEKNEMQRLGRMQYHKKEHERDKHILLGNTFAAYQLDTAYNCSFLR